MLGQIPPMHLECKRLANNGVQSVAFFCAILVLPMSTVFPVPMEET
jgi:hypothetical protein